MAELEKDTLPKSTTEVAKKGEENHFPVLGTVFDLTSTTCPICQEDYDEPKLLPCAHHLCRKCLVTWLSSNTKNPTCPVCRRNISKEDKMTSETLLDDLPTDAVLASLVESAQILRTAHVCSLCAGTEAAVDFCLPCFHKLCRACSAYHTKMVATKHHDVKPLADLTPVQLSINKREMCTLHPHLCLELYCSKHYKPICLQCLSASHSDCGSIKTISDAAKHMRQIAQAQMDKLAQANATMTKACDDIINRQQILAQSQQECRKELSALIGRLSTAIFSRENELNGDVDKVPETLKISLQKKKEDIEKDRCLATAYMEQGAAFLLHASDVNITRLAGIHAARAARLATKISQQPNIPPIDLAMLKVDVNEVLRIEELLRKVGNIKLSNQEAQIPAIGATVRPELRHGWWSSKARRFPPTEILCDEISTRFKHFSILRIDPFETNSEAKTLFTVSDHLKVACLTFDQRLLLANKSNTLFLTSTNSAGRPSDLKTLVTLPMEVRAMALLNDGNIAMTTASKSIYFVDIYQVLAKIKQIETVKLYWGIARGGDNTLVVSNDGTGSHLPPSIDVISMDGQLLEVLADSNSCPDLKQPRYLCRVGDFVVVSDCESGCLIKLSLDQSGGRTTVTLKTYLLTRRDVKLCSDYADNIYVLSNVYLYVIAMDGRRKHLYSLCMYNSICAYPDGSGVHIVGTLNNEIVSVKFKI